VPLFDNFDFSDSIISVKFELLNYGTGIRIKNNLFKSIQVDWDKGAYIDPDGQAHKIVHTSVDELERVQEPRTIPAYSFVNDTIINWDAVDWDESEEEEFEEWVVKPLFDTTCTDQNFIDPFIARHKGKQFKIILSIVRDSEPFEYIFTLEVSYFDKAKYSRAKGGYVTF
jgi:hypothetical protein